MTKTIQIGLRLDPLLVEELDRFAADQEAALRVQLPGFKFSRADAARTLLTEALQRRGYERGDEER